MVSRTWTIDEGEGDDLRCYKGFNRNFAPAELQTVALVACEDTVVMYALDDTQQARQEFFRYLKEEGQEADCIGIYQRKN